MTGSIAAVRAQVFVGGFRGHAGVWRFRSLRCAGQDAGRFNCLKWERARSLLVRLGLPYRWVGQKLVVGVLDPEWTVPHSYFFLPNYDGCRGQNWEMGVKPYRQAIQPLVDTGKMSAKI